MEDLGIAKKQRRKKGKGTLLSGERLELTKEERRILSRLSLVPVHVDELVGDGDGTLQDNLSLLLSMEKRALIHQPIRGYYTRG